MGWILFLLSLGSGLLFYNLKYLPTQEKMLRLQKEISMWTERLNTLTDSLEKLGTDRDVIFNTSYRFEEIFFSAESLRISPSGDSILRSLLPNLRGAAKVEVIGHSDTKGPLKNLFSSNWEYSAGAAAVVVRRLIALGIPAQKILAIGAADSRPIVTKSTPGAEVINRRVEIVGRAR